MTTALPRLRETASLLLLAALPFHALLVTIGTRIIAGPGHAPLSLLAAWKEGVLLLILLCAAVELLRRGTACVVDRIDVCAGVFLGVGAVWFLLHPGSQALYGVKYDLVPIAAFVLLRRVPWSAAFVRRLVAVVLCAGIATAAYGAATLLLPIDALRALGYGDLHSLYDASGPLPPFHQIGGTTLRRMQAGFGGPNQMGLWLLLPWSIAWSLLLQPSRRFFAAFAAVVTGLAIVASFSRAAWIGAVVAAAIIVAQGTSGATRLRLLAGAAAGMLGVIGVLLAFAPSVALRAASSMDHLRRPLAAVRRIVAVPMGNGLGTAGPASNRFSDTCVDLPPGADVSWALAHPQLCVFVAGKQVQTEKGCACPVLPENWYLQLGIEMGVLGMAAFLALLFVLLSALRFGASPLHRAAFAAMLGIAVAGLVLHAWEDAAVALSSWMLAAVCAPPRALLPGKTVLGQP